MKIKCEVIQDLLPLYCDKQASSESCELIEEHLHECDACRKIYQDMAEPEVEHVDAASIEDNKLELEPLKKIKSVNRKRYITTTVVILAVALIASAVFYKFFVYGWTVSSEDIEVKTRAYVENVVVDGYETTDYTVSFSFELKNGKPIEVKSNFRKLDSNDEKNAHEILTTYAQLKIPFDDRGDYPSQYEYSRSKQDEPFTDDDIIIIQYSDKAVEYNLKQIAEDAGIQ